MTGGALEIGLEFAFDAAHYFADKPSDHIYRRMHGHSFRVGIAVSGRPDPETGFVVDFAELEGAVAELRKTLDHGLLNELEGLSIPSLENVAIWVWDRLKPRFPGLCRVSVHRDSRGQSCVYAGPMSAGA
jgi:6-pyruvoyltetrahydropterin/6-carboxytetrahydropterin synthase